MGLVWTNKQELDKTFNRLQSEYEQKAIQWLSSLGEKVVGYAKEHGNYTDRTQNLRNSIGYAVVQHGKMVIDGFGSTSPQSKARQRAQEVANNLNDGKTYLIWVAGMDYAKYVEAKGYDVLEGSGNWVESTAQALMQEFKRYLAAKL